jgi:hypothetical protein
MILSWRIALRKTDRHRGFAALGYTSGREYLRQPALKIDSNCGYVVAVCGDSAAGSEDRW